MLGKERPRADGGVQEASTQGGWSEWGLVHLRAHPQGVWECRTYWREGPKQVSDTGEVWAEAQMTCLRNNKDAGEAEMGREHRGTETDVDVTSVLSRKVMWAELYYNSPILAAMVRATRLDLGTVVSQCQALPEHVQGTGFNSQHCELQGHSCTLCGRQPWGCLQLQLCISIAGQS